MSSERITAEPVKRHGPVSLAILIVDSCKQVFEYLLRLACRHGNKHAVMPVSDLRTLQQASEKLRIIALRQPNLVSENHADVLRKYPIPERRECEHYCAGKLGFFVSSPKRRECDAPHDNRITVGGEGHGESPLRRLGIGDPCHPTNVVSGISSQYDIFRSYELFEHFSSASGRTRHCNSQQDP